MLRVFYPRYIYSAESSFDNNQNRIWIRKDNVSYMRKHPDSGEPHLVIHNNLSLRQHRNFNVSNISSTINIGFFGDSFTENLRLPTEHSFTEPLDYILNTGNQNFNVLNFGVDGYGTDQAYLYYQDFKYSNNLNYVFYLFCINDLSDIIKNNLYYINHYQELTKKSYLPSSPQWIKFLSKFHTTYLVLNSLHGLDLINSRVNNFDELVYRYQKKIRESRFKDKLDEANDKKLNSYLKNEEFEKSIIIFNALISKWKNEVEKNGNKFIIVLLPRIEEYNARQIFSDEYKVINLYEKFANKHKDYKYEDWNFIKDSHWNEAANKETAIFLYRFIEYDMKFARISDKILSEEIYNYYMSFNGWKPSDVNNVDKTFQYQKTQNIKSKYHDLEMNTVNR